MPACIQELKAALSRLLFFLETSRIPTPSRTWDLGSRQAALAHSTLARRILGSMVSTAKLLRMSESPRNLGSIVSSAMPVNNGPTARRKGSKGPTAGAIDGAELFCSLRNDMRDNKAADNPHLFSPECESAMEADKGSCSQERIDMR